MNWINKILMIKEQTTWYTIIDKTLTNRKQDERIVWALHWWKDLKIEEIVPL